jgi:hypothetical protein
MRHRNRLPPTDPDAFGSVQEQMPPVGVFEEDTAATKMITQWIKQLPEVTAIGPARAASGAHAAAPMIHGNILTLPVGRAALAGLDGRRHALTPIGAGRFRLPAGLAPGIYLLDAGGRAFKLLL